MKKNRLCIIYLKTKVGTARHEAVDLACSFLHTCVDGRQRGKGREPEHFRPRNSEDEEKVVFSTRLQVYVPHCVFTVESRPIAKGV